ncbi:MAG: CcdB family protein [Pseudomonadota bacterium]|nr:CcdB family protein [Pseudomonadota bacterium]
MGQFALYENTSPDSKDAYPYFVDVQNSLLDALNTRLVIPLTPAEFLTENITRLCPATTFNDDPFILLTQQMTNVPVSALHSPVGSLQHLRDEIISALDFLVTGI